MSAILALMMAGQIVSTTPAASGPQITPVQYVEDRRGNLRGEGRRFGRGFDVERSRRSGTTTFRGTGGNFGGGYEQRGNRITGTGSRFGSGYEVQRNRITGTGSSFGAGWERRPNGSWYGTGRNFGRNCPTGSRPPVGCS
ncbi:hypothetical protein [Phreatobacter sp.]|uniref:hypothetical protein n=1 Tax=Phreatobacter sp. TaxID=1966341 RepID=UPI0022C2466E|nr:hypothetical protein [Phreatobacter sp.]MCZ8316462.1 hypothetical protein [Phreatobacter sp.]